MLGWVMIAVAVWVTIAGLAAVLIGGVVARRDRQVPFGDADIPAQHGPRRSALPLRLGRRG